MIRKRKKVVLASLLAGVFVFQQSMLLTVIANGTVITPTNGTGVTGANGVYNITPGMTNGNLGVGYFTDFQLGQGDIANFNFNDISTFANLVDNQVLINGLINSVNANGAFKDGHLIFVSPNGVVVGASGVINVGSFSAYAPNQAAFNALKNGQGNLSDLEKTGYATDGTITVDGKILSRGDVTLYANGINIGKDGAILANVNAGNITARTDLDNLFTKLVNTDGIINNDQQAFVSDKAGKILIKSTNGIDLKGNVKNYANGSGSSTTIQNSLLAGKTNTGKLNVAQGANITAKNGELFITNNAGDLNIAGNVRNQGGNTKVQNTPYTLDSNGNPVKTSDSKLNVSGNINSAGNVLISNAGNNGMNISGNVKSNANTEIKNGFSSGNVPYNTAALDITGNVNTDGNLTVTNYKSGVNGLNITGKVNTQGKTEVINHGEAGLNVKDNARVFSNGDAHFFNDANGGITIEPDAKINGDNNIHIENRSTGEVKVQGYTNSKKSTTIDSYGGNIILGHDTTNENVYAGQDININAYDANIWNYARDTKGALHAKDGAKTFLVAEGNLNMYAENGTIGDDAGGVCESGNCTGIGAVGTRDFNKSINANIKGKVNAKTVDKAAKQNDLVINYAAIDSDMNLDNVDADGKVILTVDYGTDGTSRYNINNVATDKSKANIEGWGLSVISSGNIGDANNKVTFNQTNAGTLRTAKNDGLIAGNANATDGYGMDVLANGDVHMKALDDKYTVNNVCSMVSREGSLDVEFSGNTYIEEVTAKKDVNLVTRGQTMEINHLGTVPTLGDNGQIGNNVYDTYLGGAERVADNANFGDDDGNGYDHATPNNATVKALDINKNIRPNGQMVSDTRPTGTAEDYYAYAGSTAVVRNSNLEVGKPGEGNLDITADHVYSNEVVAHFTDDGFVKEKDTRTNPAIGNTPTGHAVRPQDVDDIGRDYHERNYYYPEGDGDIPDGWHADGYKPANPDGKVDNDNGIADATPMIIPVKDTTPAVRTERDDHYYWKKNGDNNVQAIDKRQYMRFNVSDNSNPVALEQSNNGINRLLDISRGGIAVQHNGDLKVGDVVPVHITYGDLDINAEVKVVSATTSRAGAEFVNLNQATANQLLYLSILLDDKNNVAFNK